MKDTEINQNPGYGMSMSLISKGIVNIILHKTWLTIVNLFIIFDLLILNNTEVVNKGI